MTAAIQPLNSKWHASLTQNVAAMNPGTHLHRSIKTQAEDIGSTLENPIVFTSANDSPLCQL
jgi:hypothetical protein